MNVTLGDVIGKYRVEMGLSISDVESATKITRLKRIENGTVGQPKLQTLDKLIDFLEIPLEAVAEKYASKVNNKEVVMEMVRRVLPTMQKESLFNITNHYISICSSATAGINELSQLASETQEKTYASLLYSVLATHAITYNKNNLLAEFLFYEYMFERDLDLTKSYYLGRRLLDNAHMLDEEKRIIAFYKVGVHARLLKRYDESIDYLRTVVEDHSISSTSSYKEKAYPAFYTNLITVGRVEEGEHYLEEYAKTFNRYDSSSYIIDKATIYFKNQKTQKALSMLEKYMENFETHHNTIVAINLLLEIYIKTNQFDKARDLYRFEDKFDLLIEKNNRMGPFNQMYFGLYLRLKGRVEFLLGGIHDAVEALLDSMEIFAGLGLKEEFLESMHLLHTLNLTHQTGKYASNSIIGINAQYRITEYLHLISKK
nr:helix-turn-helix transcriptional regulator [Brevibacillus laterosporus]